MKRLLVVALFVGLTVSLSMGMAANGGQAAAQSSTAQSTAANQAHGTFSVALTKDLDSKKLKEGDPVSAKLTGGITLPSGAVVPRGAQVIGHVTQAKARSKKDADSTLGITFDKIALSGGENVAIQGTVLAAAPNPDLQNAGGAGLADGYNNLKDITTKGAMSAPSNQASTPLLTEDSRGVLGMKTLKLDDGVFTSTGKEVKLDEGTRMLLSVAMAK